MIIEKYKHFLKYWMKKYIFGA